jgi:hypothetical protein
LANISGTVQSGATAVTATTSLNHGLVIGQNITIAGSDVSAHNGDYVVADENGSTTFIYVIAGAATTSGTTATVLSKDNEFAPGVVAGENIQFTKKSGRLQITGDDGTNTANTLDAAYDHGGAGSGRTIAANNGAVAITVADASNNNALDITQSDDNNNKDGIKVTMEGTGAGLRIKGSTNDTAKLVLENDNASYHFTISQPDGGGVVAASSHGMGLVTGGSTDLEIITAGVVAVTTGKGLHLGEIPPTDFDNFSLSVGPNTQVTGSSAAVGQGNTITGSHCLAVGQANTVAAPNQAAIGYGATTAGYTAAPVLAMSDNTAIGGAYTKNTVVIDSGVQFGAGSPGSGSGPIGGGSSRGATKTSGSTGRGNVYLDGGGLYSGSADYAELFEWDDGNPNNDDRRGFFVSLVNGNKIKVGHSNIVGVTSSRPIILGDAAQLGWHGRYLLDEFGSPEQELKDGLLIPKYNPNYNASEDYVPRRQRKEWAPVGLLGKLFVRTAPKKALQRALSAGSKCTSNSAGYAVRGSKYHILRVIRPATKTKYGIVEILVK